MVKNILSEVKLHKRIVVYKSYTTVWYCCVEQLRIFQTYESILYEYILINDKLHTYGYKAKTYLGAAFPTDHA